MRNLLSRIFWRESKVIHQGQGTKTKEISLLLEDNSGDKAIVKSGTKKRTSTSDVYPAKKRRSFLSNTGKALLDEVSAAGIMNFPAQINVPLGKSLGTKPLQPQPQPQCYELIKRTGQIKRYNGCDVLFSKVDEDLCVLGRHELDWYPAVDKKHSTKIYKIAKRNFYYCTKRKCILARRPLISLESIDIKHGAGIG